MIKDNQDVLEAATKILSALLLGYALALHNVAMGKHLSAKKQLGENNQLGGFGSQEVSGATISTATNLARDILDSVVPIVDKTFTGVVTGRYARMNPEDASKNLHDMLSRQTELLIRISNDEALLKKLEVWAMLSAQVGIQALSTALPAIDDIVDEFWIATNSVITKSITASINTGFNVSEAAISEIPIMGGVIILFTSFIRGINEGLLAAGPAVKAGTKNSILSAKTGQNIASGLKKNIDKANQAAQELTDALNVPLNSNTINDITNTGRNIGMKSMEQLSKNTKNVGSVGSVGVGGKRTKPRLSKRSLKKNMHKSSKRLEKHLNKFSIKKTRRKHKN